MDYEAKAKELREKIFSHAEEGHGGPCLRSGPLDKLLEDWLRLNCAPQASTSYPYGHRVSAEPAQPSMTHAKPSAEDWNINLGPMTMRQGDQRKVNRVELGKTVEALLKDGTAKLPAGTFITPELIESMRTALYDAQLYGTGFLVAGADIEDKPLTAREMTPKQAREFRDQYLSDPFNQMQTSWPTPRPSDPAEGDIYIDHDRRRYEWTGMTYGWKLRRS
jgi:hypothetical protein